MSKKVERGILVPLNKKAISDFFILLEIIKIFFETVAV